MPQLVEIEDIGLVEFPDDASIEEITRESNRLDLQRRSHPEAVMEDTWKDLSAFQKLEADVARGGASGGSNIAGTLKGAARNANMGAPAMLRGLASEFAFAPESQQFLQAADELEKRTPAQIREDEQKHPAFQLGQKVQETTDKWFPRVQPAGRTRPFGATAEAVGNMAPALATGPGALIAGTLAEFNDAYERELQRQKDEGEEENPALAWQKATFYAGSTIPVELSLGVGYILRQVKRYFGPLVAAQAGRLAIKGGKKAAYSFLGDRLKDAGAGFSQEFIEAATQDLIVSGNLDLAKDFQEGLMGLTGQTVIGGGLHGASLLSQRLERALQAQQQQEQTAAGTTTTDKGKTNVPEVPQTELRKFSEEQKRRSGEDPLAQMEAELQAAKGKKPGQNVDVTAPPAAPVAPPAAPTTAGAVSIPSKPSESQPEAKTATGAAIDNLSSAVADLKAALEKNQVAPGPATTQPISPPVPAPTAAVTAVGEPKSGGQAPAVGTPSAPATTAAMPQNAGASISTPPRSPTETAQPATPLRELQGKLAEWNGIVGYVGLDETGRPVLESSGRLVELPGNADATAEEIGLSIYRRQQKFTSPKVQAVPGPQSTNQREADIERRIEIEREVQGAVDDIKARQANRFTPDPTSVKVVSAVVNVARNPKAPMQQRYGALEAAPTAKRIITGTISRLEAENRNQEAERWYKALRDIEAFENAYQDVVTAPAPANPQKQPQSQSLSTYGQKEEKGLPEVTQGAQGETPAAPTGLSEAEAQAEIDAWQRQQQRRGGSVPVELVNDKEWTSVGSDGKRRGVRGSYTGRGIRVNRAHIQSRQELRQVLKHERVHWLLTTPEGQAMLERLVKGRLGESGMAALKRKYAQGQNESNEAYEARLREEWLARLAEEDPGTWKRIVEAVRKWLAKFKMAHLTDEEIGRQILRAMDKGSVNVGEPTSQSLSAEDAEAELRLSVATYPLSEPEEIPERTQTAYKLMRVYPSKPGYLFPLYARPEDGQAQGFEFGKWYKALKQIPKIGGNKLALRPGIHAVDLPIFSQGKARVKGEQRVWVEVEMPAMDPKTQAESDSTPLLDNGQREGIRNRLIGPKEAYNFRTNPNASGAGAWPIAGSVKLVRVLSDAEVEKILRDAGAEQHIENSMTGFEGEKVEAETPSHSLSPEAPRSSGAAAGNERLSISDSVREEFKNHWEKYLTARERFTREHSIAAFMEYAKLLPTAEEFAAAALAGKAKLGWYAKSAAALARVFGPDAPRFAALLAALSPQTSVESNLRNALNVWVAWVNYRRPAVGGSRPAPRPTDPQTIFQIMADNVEGEGGDSSVLPAWKDNTLRALTAEDPSTIVLSGPKVNSFMENLRGVLNEVTNDTWMANFALLRQAVFGGSLNKNDPGKSPAYKAMNAVVRKAADLLTEQTGDSWSPAEVQETVWSWAKALVEMAEEQGEKRTPLEIVKQNALSEERIAGTPDFAKLLSGENEFHEILKAGGYEEQLRDLASHLGPLEQASEQRRQLGGQTEALTGPLEKSAARLTNLLAFRREQAAIKADIAALKEKFVERFGPAANVSDAKLTAALESGSLETIDQIPPKSWVAKWNALQNRLAKLQNSLAGVETPDFTQRGPNNERYSISDSELTAAEANRIKAEYEARDRELTRYLKFSDSAQTKLMINERHGQRSKFTPEEEAIVEEWIKDPNYEGPPGNTYEQTAEYKRAMAFLTDRRNFSSERLSLREDLEDQLDTTQTTWERLRAQLSARYRALPLRGQMSMDKDAADNIAATVARRLSNLVLHELNREFGTKVDQRNQLRDFALTFVVEGGGTREGLTELRGILEGAGEGANRTWRRRALQAIAFAEENFDKLKPAADLYRRITDLEVALENRNGIDTLYRSGGYVFHVQDVSPDWAMRDVASGSGAPSAPFRHIRDHPTYAHSIAAGLTPESLDAVGLLQKRLTLGRKQIAYRAWIDSMREFIDPTTQTPMVVEPEIRMRADGTQDVTAPAGYRLIKFGGQEIAMHQGYSNLFESLTRPSTINTEMGSAIVKAAAVGKHTMLLMDTFHLGRLAFWNAMARGIHESTPGGFLPGLPTYQRGLALLENSAEELRNMAERDEIPEAWVSDLAEAHSQLQLLLQAGLNVGKVSDNLHIEWVQKIPVTGHFNRWLFEKYQRGAVAEASIIEFRRQKRQTPEDSDIEIARRVAKDLNTRFGALNSQSVIKNKTLSHLARIVFLAPQWNEGLIRSELGAIAQTIGTAKELATKRRFHMGALARTTGTAFLGGFLAAQIINFVTRGRFTWDNDEEELGAKLSAWVPDLVGDGPGFFLNPMALPLEVSHMLEKWAEKKGGDWSWAVRQYFAGRLGYLGRPVQVFWDRRTPAGKPLRGGMEVLGGVLQSLVPVPIGFGAYGTAAAQLATGESRESWPGQIQKQVMQSFGIKADDAPSADSRMHSLARDWLAEQPDSKPLPDFGPGVYSNLRRALLVKNRKEEEQALEDLRLDRTDKDILKDMATWVRRPYTGSKVKESQFIQSLDEEQLATYKKAKQAKQAMYERLVKLVSSTPRAQTEPD